MNKLPYLLILNIIYTATVPRDSTYYCKLALLNIKSHIYTIDY